MNGMGMWSRCRLPGLTSSAVFVRHVAQLTSLHAIPSMRTTAPKINHSLESSNLRKALLARPGLLGIKRGMITWFTEDNKQFGATVIEIDACEVIKNKTIETHGYNSVMLGQSDKLKNVSDKNLRLFQEAGVSPKKHIAEFRVREESGLIEVGTEIRADYFAVGQLVDVKAVTKGKGFAGVMKRHGFKGLRATHGVSVAHRSAGSMGATQDPGRILPGKKMAGRMGGKNCTVHNNEVLFTDAENGIIIVKGQVPGPNRGFIKLNDAKKLYAKALNTMK